jgi:hypothetical protein
MLSSSSHFALMPYSNWVNPCALTARRCSHLIPRSAIALYVRHPSYNIQASCGLSESCPKIGDVPKSPFPPVAALVPSAGAITLQIKLRSDAGALSTLHPVGVRTRAARVPTHRKAKIMEVRSILQGPSLTRLLQGAAAGGLLPPC